VTYKQNQTRRGISSAYVANVALLLVVVLLGSGRVPVVHGYNADATTAITGLTQHSSFHYEMVRVLAVLAGFDKYEAEEIAVAGEAVDLGTFTGYKTSQTKAKTINIRNTNRFGSNGRLYHFARRSSQYEKVDADGARSNTCEYFKLGDRRDPNTAPCTVKGPELDQIKNWAFDLPGPKPGADELPKNALRKTIKPKTLIALAIYLHSIGDAYSHEKCMIDQSFRFHKPIPFSCNTKWHTDPERGEFTVGIAFTKTAANEVWRALRQYKGADGSNPPGFITEFVAHKDACERVKFAVDTFNALTGGETKIRCPPSASKTSRNSRRRD
jgi:hypothetical protein